LQAKLGKPEKTDAKPGVTAAEKSDELYNTERCAELSKIICNEVQEKVKSVT